MKIKTIIASVVCIATLNDGINTSAFLRAHDGGVTVTLKVPESVVSGEEIPVQVVITNTSGRKILVPPTKARSWGAYLYFAGRTFLLQKEDRDTPLVSHRRLPTKPEIGEAKINLDIGEKVTYSSQLRQIFQFPEDDTGRYCLTFWDEDLACSKVFSITPAKGEETTLATFESKVPAYVYGEKDKNARHDVRLSRRVHEGKKSLIAATSYRYSKGNTLLATGGDDLLSAKYGIALLERSGIEHQDTEYIGIVWLVNGEAHYTTYGIDFYRDIPQNPPAEYDPTSVPDYRQIVKPMRLPCEGGVKDIRGIASEEEYLCVSYTASDGSLRSLTVDEKGKTVDLSKPRIKEDPNKKTHQKE